MRESLEKKYLKLERADKGGREDNNDGVVEGGWRWDERRRIAADASDNTPLKVMLLSSLAPPLKYHMQRPIFISPIQE
ncbi:hypothetical protein Drorol1_Dr00000920 [Drosera rotundifolia]